MTKVSWSRLMFFVMLILVLALAACGNGDTAEEEPADDPDTATEETDESEEATEETDESEDATEETDGSEDATEEADESEDATKETDGSEDATEEADESEDATEETDGSEDATEEADDSETASDESAETEPQVTDFEPAFPEQTRAPEVETEAELDVEVVVDGLDVTWGMEEFDTNRILVTQRDEADLLIIDLEDGSASDPIEGTPEVNNEDQGGLLDVTIAPDFDESRMVFLTFAQDMDDGTVTAVGRGALSEDESSLEDFEVIFQATPAYDGTLHYGGRIIFDDDGNLFLTTGERSDDPIRERAQDLDAYLGKVIHITQDGEPVDTNPFIEDEDALDGIYSYGHRNIQGVDFHPETGDLWIVEFGPQAGDELNIIEPGANYGWPVVSYGIEYSGELVNEGISEHEEQGFVEPRYYWDPTSAPSGMSFYDNDAIPEWENDLFIGGLAPNYIVRVVIEDDIIVGEERLLTDEGERFRDILVTEDGALIASTDGGVIYQITEAGEGAEEDAE